jgi:hypothetical protein
MGEIVPFPAPKTLPPLFHCEDEDSARHIGRLKVILIDELDFTLRKMIALCGLEEAQRFVNERIVATGLKPLEMTVEAPCA